MKTIVVGVDASHRRSLVLDAAQALANRIDARVVLVSAIEGSEWQTVLPPETAAWNDGAVWAKIEGDCRSALDDAARRFAPGCVVDRRVAHGPAWRVLCDAAHQHGAQLIVIGAHGYRLLERMIGTTASKIANRADTSVLVVRAGELSFARVLVGHDGAPTADRILQNACALAERKLTVVRAINPADHVTAQIWGKRPDEIEAYLIRLATASLARSIAATDCAATVEHQARIGSPWQVLIESAHSAEATLIVIGSHGYDAVDRVLGTVAGRVVNHAEQSVLIVRGAGLA